MTALGIFLLYCVTLFDIAHGQVMTAKVSGVSAGDHLAILHENRTDHIDLYGIMCPKKGQPFWDTAKEAVTDMVFGRSVEVDIGSRDIRGRRPRIVRVNGLILNEELVRAGVAWVYQHECKLPLCDKWRGLEAEARSERRGLWADPNPVPPWQFKVEKKTKWKR